MKKKRYFLFLSKLNKKLKESGFVGHMKNLTMDNFNRSKANY